MKIKPKNLLLLAAFVWIIAAYNILRIGVIEYKGHTEILNLIISAVIFTFFWLMVFKKLVKKHTARILEYKEKMNFLYFFDKKSYIIMLFMMSLGISIRRFKLWPDLWIAIFYVGLGLALLLAGFSFMMNFLKNRR